MTLSVLIAVTHLLGVGHLSRAAAIGRALVRRGHRVTLVSGGAPARLVSTAGLRFVQLPPVRTAPGDFHTLLDESGRPVAPDRMAERGAVLAAEVERARPDVLVTELFPFGRRVLAEEFLAAIDQAKACSPGALIACSIRDILVAPDRPDKLAETHARLARHYDAILVHGDSSLMPLAASWPLEPALEERLYYTGFVDAADEPSQELFSDGAREIIVSGGGSAASLPLFEAALTAAATVTEHPWRMLVGAGVDEAPFEALLSRAPPHVAVERARADFRSLMAFARLSISQAGYNTVVDILASGVPSVLVPYEQGQESEQRQRAAFLVKQGRAVCLPEAELSGDNLARTVRAALARPQPAITPFATDGAAQSARVLERLATGSARAFALASAKGDGWAVLSRALARAEDAGALIPFWWRDDDAVVHTPELDRLIAISRRLACPLALAAIPIKAQRSLAARIADEPAIRVLVHGWSHANHAAEGAKKAEFGPDRRVVEARRDAAAALSSACSLFGAKLTPVFVPPWNRIAPAIAAELPRLGYAALSTFGRKLSAPALPQVQTHIDPIDWRGSRDLADPDRLLRLLADAVVARTACQTPDPIGLLTHHLASPEPVWQCCERLIAALKDSPAIRPISIDDLLVSSMRHPTMVAGEEEDGLGLAAQGLG